MPSVQLLLNVFDIALLVVVYTRHVKVVVGEGCCVVWIYSACIYSVTSQLVTFVLFLFHIVVSKAAVDICLLFVVIFNR